MSFEATDERWQAAATTASSSTLADRRQIYDAEVTNVSALRKAAQRLHDLGQLRKALASGLG